MSEEEILAGHFQSTRERLLAENEPVVILHDTTEFSFKREDIDAIGRLNKGAAGKNHQGRTNYYTSCGILMHSSLAVTTEGLPLGLAAIKIGHGTSSKEPIHSKGGSIRREFLLSKRKASARWRI